MFKFLLYFRKEQR